MQKKNRTFLSLSTSFIEKEVREAKQMTDSLPCAMLPQQKTHKPCSHLAKPVCTPPCYCRPRNDTGYYHTQGKCFIRLLLQLLKAFLNKFVISHTVLSILSLPQEDTGSSKSRLTSLFFLLRLTTDLMLIKSCVTLTKALEQTLFKRSHPRQVCVLYFLQYT